MTLADGMRPLVQHLPEAFHARRAAFADLRATTAQQLADSHTAQERMAAEQRRFLVAHLDTLRSDTASFLAELDAAHEAMAAESRERLAEYAADLRRSTARFVEELHAAHQAMGTELRQNLSADVSRLRQEAASFVQAMGEATRERLDEMMAALRHDTAELLEQVETAREAMAKGQRKRLAAAHADLTRSVGAARGAMQADLQETRRLWRSIPALKGKKPRAKREAAAEAKAAPEPAAKRPDDLTEIPGVGPTLQQRLKEAGISTFAHLARRSPDQLRAALGEVGARANVEEWIAYARQASAKA